MSLPIVRLKQGLVSYELNNHVRFFLWPDFIPPAVSVTPLFASGTSANRSGAELVDRRPNNRAFTFRVRMVGGSTAEIRQWTSKLQTFLNGAGNAQLPLYLEYKPDSDTPEPLWGQYGATLRYEVVHGTVSNMADYMKGNRLASDVDLEFSLVLKPFALGKQQRVASATGRIHEDLLGVTDGVSRGLVLGRNHTNKCTNPVFGHSTWNTGWTADASLTATKNVFREYLAPGATASALLISRSTNQEFYQSINVGNTQTHTFLALVMRPDFGTITSDDAVLFYSSALTTTFTDLGGGLYAMTATATGINASTNTGIQVKNGRSIYLLYYGAVDTDDTWFYPFWGDNLGCAWSGTAHNSTSTSTAGRVRLPVAADTAMIEQGTIRVVCRIPASTAFVNPVFFSFGATSLRASLTLSTMTLTLTDNTSTASSSASAVTVGQTVILHYVWSASGGLSIYLNGTLVANNSGFTLPAAPTYLYIGTGDGATEQTEYPIHDFSVWAEALTAAQISADADALNDLTDDRLRIAPYPWLWTKDGDDVVDNCDDSSRDNWCVVGGVPGSEAADVKASLAPSTGTTDIYFVRHSRNLHDFRLPTLSGYYYDASGTVDANSSGGQYWNMAAIDESLPVVSNDVRNSWGKLSVFARCRAVSNTVTTNKLYAGILNEKIGESIKNLASSSYFRLAHLASYYVLPDASVDYSRTGVTLIFYLLQNTASFYLDFHAIYPGDVTRVRYTGVTIYNQFTLFPTTARMADGAPDVRPRLIVEGDEFRPSPLGVNIIWTLADNTTLAGSMEIARTLTYSEVYITPRYTLL